MRCFLNYRDTRTPSRGAALGADVPGQRQLQLTQTLIVHLLNTHFFTLVLDCVKSTEYSSDPTWTTAQEEEENIEDKPLLLSKLPELPPSMKPVVKLERIKDIPKFVESYMAKMLAERKAKSDAYWKSMKIMKEMMYERAKSAGARGRQMDRGSGH